MKQRSKRKAKNSGETDRDENSSDDNDEDFNPTLAAMGSELNLRS